MDSLKKDFDFIYVSIINEECEFDEIVNFPLLDMPYVFPYYSDNN